MMIGAMAIGIAAMLATPHVTHSFWGVVSGAGALNLRSCAGTNCARITAMPNGARVWIDGTSGGWYHVRYNGVVGYASARYISAGGSAAAAPVVKRPQSAPMGGSSGGSSSSRGGYSY